MSKQKKVEEDELKNYAQHFDGNIAYTLLKTLRKSTRDKPAIIAGATGAIVTVLGKLLSAWENPATPAPLKALAIGAIGYIILPVDLIPDVLPVVGYTDDLASAGETILSEMADDGVFMHNAPRKNMNRLISKEQLDCIEQRNIIETVRSVMKGRFELVYTKARSLKGMFRHFFYSIAAFLISQSACRQKLFISG